MYFPDLLAEYKQLLQQMKVEGVTSGDMYREVKQAIEWMETGYDPAEYRAATRIDAYTMDIHLMQDIISYVDSEMMTPDYLIKHNENVSDTEFNREINRMYKIKQDVKSAMSGLTENERAVFILIKCDLLTYAKAAKVMGISKSCIQSYMRRAEQKIHANISKGNQEELDLFAM